MLEDLFRQDDEARNGWGGFGVMDDMTKAMLLREGWE